MNSCNNTVKIIHWFHACLCVANLSGVSSVNVTLSGRTCQRWDSLVPHVHPYTHTYEHNVHNYGHNYCARPDGDVTAWCYTTDANQTMEYCYEDQSTG